MKIAEIYHAFDKIGCLSFTTVNAQHQPESRIAHLRGFDENGMYFMTMYTKNFYKHLKNNENISLCGLSASSAVEHDEEGMPLFQGGYAIRMTGQVEEVSIAEIKAKNNPIFDVCIKDQEKYPAMVVFCIKSGSGDIFDYDFELTQRENKLQRTYFSFHGGKIQEKGLKIDPETCISCGLCQKKCSFRAITVEEGKYTVDTSRCDECGDCFLCCPVQAISHRKEG